jgi:phytoene dehydrogenase-like protein
MVRVRKESHEKERGYLARRDFLALAPGAAAYAVSLGCAGVKTLSGGDDGLYDVVIVGGGLSGLVAAHLLRGHNILLLEKERVPGGRILGGTWEGFHYSLGASYMGPPDEEMQEAFDELGVTPIPVPPPVDAVAHGGVIYPEDYLDSMLGSISEFRDYIRVSRELHELSEDGIGDATYEIDLEALSEYEELDRLSVRQWLEREKVGPIVRRFIDVENRGLFGASNGDISLLFDVAEMAFNLYEGDLDDSDFSPRAVPDFHTHWPDVDEGDVDLWTFRRGMMELVSSYQQLEGLRGRIRCNANVSSVQVNRDRTVTIDYSQDGSTRSVRAYAVILATPAAVTASLVRSGFSNAVMEALRSVPYTTYVTMAIFLSERLFRTTWNIACLDTCFTTLNDAIRTQVPLDYRGRSVLGVAMPPERADDRSLIGMSDDALLEKALKDIERYFPGVRTRVIGKDIHRFQYAFPVFGPGYGEILWALHSDETTRGPLFLAGDFMVYPTLGGAAASAERVSDLVEGYAETL